MNNPSNHLGATPKTGLSLFSQNDNHRHQSNADAEEDYIYDAEIIDDYESIENHEIIRVSEDEIAVKFFLFDLILKGNLKIEFFGRLYWPGVIMEIQGLGYFKRTRADGSFIFIKKVDNIIREVTCSQMKDEFFTKCLKKLDAPLHFVYENIPVVLTVEAQQQAYLNQANQIFNVKFLEHLETFNTPALEDSSITSYFFFLNQIVFTDREEIDTMNYSDLRDKCVWVDHIIKHEFQYTGDFNGAHYPRFIRNVVNEEADRLKAFHSAIGYLLNNHNSPSQSQAVICYDEVPSVTGDPNGGTGKGVFCKAIKQLRNTFKLDGKNIRRDDKFKFQGITEQTQVFWLDDIHRDFPFEMLYSCITDGFTVEKKYQHQFYIPAENSPKIVLCSNMILTAGGTTNIRRQFILEFGNHYSRHIVTGAEEPIKDIHGGLFFDKESWDESEWNKFFSFMIYCSQLYHANGLKPYTQVGQERGRLIQLTSPEFVTWVTSRNLQVGEEFDNNTLYQEYCEYAEVDQDTFPQRRFTGWIRIYAEIQDWQLHTRSSNGRRYSKFIPS